MYIESRLLTRLQNFAKTCVQVYGWGAGCFHLYLPPGLRRNNVCVCTLWSRLQGPRCICTFTLPTNHFAVKVKLALSLLTCHTASWQTTVQPGPLCPPPTSWRLFQHHMYRNSRFQFNFTLISFALPRPLFALRRIPNCLLTYLKETSPKQRTPYYSKFWFHRFIVKFSQKFNSSYIYEQKYLRIAHLILKTKVGKF